MALLEWTDTASSGWVDTADTEWVDGLLIHRHRIILSQIFDLVNRFHRHFLVQPYYLSDLKRTEFVTTYSIKLMAILTQYYGDVPRLRTQLQQWYWDATAHRKELTQEYDDYAIINKDLNVPWNVLGSILNDTTIDYSILGTLVANDLTGFWDVRNINIITNALNSPYMILGESSSTTLSMPEVLLNGVSIEVESINFEGTLDAYCISASLGFKEYTLFTQCKLDDIIQITIGSDIINLFIESKQRARNINNPIQYTVNCLSLCAKLDSPYAIPVNGDLGPNWASDIADSLVTTLGLSLTWDIVDQYYTSDTFFGNENTPLEILRRLATPTKGRVQTLLDGTVKIIEHYPDSPTTWKTVTPIVYLTDSANFFSTDEQADIRLGYNKFLISNTLTAESSDRLEEVEISSSKKYIQAYQVPWIEGTDIPFYTSGGSHVTITTNPTWLAGITEEITEQIEIIKGLATTSKPIYGIVSFDYLETHLGGLTHSEDGTIQTDIPDQSLLSITYTTKYRQWEVTDLQIEDVQFILGEPS